MSGNILVPIDGSQNAEKALKAAVHYGKQLDATLQIVSIATDQRYVQYGVTLGQDVMQSFETRANALLDQAKKEAEKAGVKAETHFIIGVPKIQIAEKLPAQFKATMTIMGKSGVNGISRAILGSTTEYVVRHATNNVFVINDPEE